LELDMPYKNREQDYHLTPVGWTTNEIASAYTIETWRHSVYREFAWSKEQHAWRRIWHNLAWSETERERFRQTFPLPAQVQETPPSATQPLPDEDAERKRA
jgi:hypothetical protein